MNLPADIARCISTKCPRCKECARWVTSASPEARVFIVGNPDNCEFFLPYKPEEHKP